MRRLRGAAMIASTLLALVGGIFFGEDLISLYPTGLLVMLGLVIVAGVGLTPGGVTGKIVGAVILILPLLAGFAAGRYEGTTAFQESVDRAEPLQAALEAYRGAQGKYPDRLEALRGFEVPGRRLIRGRALHYQRTDTGYRIEVRRWSLHFRGDERTPLAHQESTP